MISLNNIFLLVGKKHPTLTLKASGSSARVIFYVSGSLPILEEQPAKKREKRIVEFILREAKKLNLASGIVWKVNDRQVKDVGLEAQKIISDSIIVLRVRTYIRKNAPCRSDSISFPECSSSQVGEAIELLLQKNIIGRTKSGYLYTRLDSLIHSLVRRQGVDRMLDKNSKKKL